MELSFLPGQPDTAIAPDVAATVDDVLVLLVVVPLVIEEMVEETAGVDVAAPFMVGPLSAEVPVFLVLLFFFSMPNPAPRPIASAITTHRVTSNQKVVLLKPAIRGTFCFSRSELSSAGIAICHCGFAL